MTEPAAHGADGQPGAPGETASGVLTVIPPPSGRISIGDADGTLPAYARLLPPAPIGADAKAVRAWFDDAVEIAEPEMDGTLGAERAAAQAYQRMAKAKNTRAAYRSAVRAWCDWCAKRDLPPLPACGQDVAAFLAAERRREMTPNTIDLRRAAIRYLHRAAGCPVPTDDACVSETVAGIRRDAAAKGQSPEKKVAATAAIIQQLLAPIQDDLRGKRDRALLLVGFAGALRRSELASIRVDRLEKTDRGLRLTIQQTKGSQTDAVVVPLPYGRTELCPVRALNAWLAAAGITDGPVFRRIWLPPRGGAQGRGKRPASGKLPAKGPQPGEAAEDAPPPLPQIGKAALTSRSIADIVQARAVAAGFARRDLAGHSLKRGALTTGMDRGIHPAKLKRLGRHKSFDVLGEYLEFGDLFDGHPLTGVL
jgi:site-specific recombinase XerC